MNSLEQRMALNVVLKSRKPEWSEVALLSLSIQRELHCREKTADALAAVELEAAGISDSCQCGCRMFAACSCPTTPVISVLEIAAQPKPKRKMAAQVAASGIPEPPPDESLELVTA